MSDTSPANHESLFQLCVASAPLPWYPKLYAQTAGVSRDSLDIPLNDMRLAGLIRLTDWEKDKGQGYVLTEFGEEALKNDTFKAHLRNGFKGALPLQVESLERPKAEGEETRFERGEKVRKAFYYPEPLRVVPVLVLINILAFVASFVLATREGVPAVAFLTQGNAQVLLKLGALSPPDLVRGEWWRLLTCCFLHFGLIHLAVNMVSLFGLGLAETFWGTWRYLVIYFFSGLGGSCVAMIYDPGLPNQSPALAGASGAIWGMMTSVAAWVFMNRSHLPPDVFARWLPRYGFIVAINVGVSFMPTISTSAHFGGGAVGIATAVLLHLQRVTQPPRRTGATILLFVLPLLGAMALRESMDQDPRWLALKNIARLKDSEKARARFDEVIVAVDKAETVFLEMKDDAFAVTGQNPAKRKTERVKKVLAEVKTVREFVKTAEGQLGEKPGDEELKAGYTAGKDYLNSIDDVLNRFDQILENNGEWAKDERAEIQANQKKLRLQWNEAKIGPKGF